MAASRLAALVQRIVEQPGSAFGAPGAGVVVLRGDRVVDRIFFGTDAAGRPFGPDSLFPIASSVKLATGLTLHRLCELGRLALDDPLARHLPEAAAARPDVTLRALLSHVSGLPLDLSPESVTFDEKLDWPTLKQACLCTPLQDAPRVHFQYSNLGYGLLGITIERASGMSYQDAVRSLVLEPLGIEAYLGRAPPRAAAAIGDVRSRHVGTPVEPYNSTFWQALGLPWSGLVTTAEGLLSLALAYAGRSALIRAETCAEATRNQNGTLGGGFRTRDPFLGMDATSVLTWPACNWGLGIEVRGEKSPHWSPPLAGAASFGHIGSSGCVVWVVPSADTAWVVVGTRTTDGGWLLRHAAGLGLAILRG